MSNAPTQIPVGSWSDIHPRLSDQTQGVLNQMDFPFMTPVQAATIPQLMSFKDVAVEACTGSGKTLAFVVPAIELLLKALSETGKSLTVPLDGNQQRRLLSPLPVDVLVVVPIRELAAQVSEIFRPFAATVGARLYLMTGGESKDQQLVLPEPLVSGKGFERDDDPEASSKICAQVIVVGTPGRLRQSLCSRTPLLSARDIKLFVMDEADKLLEMGFTTELNDILGVLAKHRRTGLFSATQTDEVKQLVRAGLRNPVAVNVEVRDRQTKQVQKIPSTLVNFFVQCSADQKLSQLIHLLKKRSSQEKTIVYFLTCACVDFFWKFIHTSEPSLKVFSLHGKVPPEKRKEVYKKFLGALDGVLLTTDVAARGLDIPNIDWVIQFDPPQDPNMFVHRIGRTARMGKAGKALVFLEAHEETYINLLAIRKVPIERIELEPCPDLLPALKQRVLKDRELMERGQTAFVSFIRGYKEHMCNYIFRLASLDFGALARSFGLLQLPRMPEIPSQSKVENFIAEPKSVIDAVPFLAKKREKERRLKLKQRQEQQRKESHDKKARAPMGAWSKKKELIGKRKERKEKRARKRSRKEMEKDGESSDKNGSISGASKTDGEEEAEETQMDWRELVAEKNQKKKMKRRKVKRQNTGDAREESEGDSRGEEGRDG